MKPASLNLQLLKALNAEINALRIAVKNTANELDGIDFPKGWTIFTAMISCPCSIGRKKKPETGLPPVFPTDSIILQGL